MNLPRFHHVSSRVRILFGILSIILGLVGLVLPILQGWLFIGIGVILLSRDIPFFRRLTVRLERRFPWFARIRQVAKKRYSRRE